MSQKIRVQQSSFDLDKKKRGISAVDVIIPVYRTERDIIPLIDSIYSQKCLVPLHIIVCFSEVEFLVVRNFKKKYPHIKTLYEKKRTGKLGAINKMLEKSNAEIVILSSSDVVWNDSFLSKILEKFSLDVVAVASHPQPRNFTGFIGSLYNAYWLIHHRLSSRNPKFGETIAFRRRFRQLPCVTSADEELIVSELYGCGRFVYAADAFVYNKQPPSFSILFSQRYRYYAGHKKLYAYNNFKSSALSFYDIFLSLFSFRILLFLPFILSIEIIVRLKYFFSKKDSLLW